MDKEYAEYLLKKTKEDYNQIAEDFSTTRDYVSEDMIMLSKYAYKGDKILDLGCGNGRLIELFEGKGIEYIGVDNSEKMIEIARARYPGGKFLVIPDLNLPFSDNSFDKVYCLAVLHHIPSDEFRLQFLNEIKRILKPGGLLILTVWNLWHLWFKPFLWLGYKRLRKYFFLILKYTTLKVFNKSKIDFKDIFMPWRETTQRYVHCFTKGELKRLTKKSGFKISEIGVTQHQKTKESGIYIIVEK